MHELTEPSGIVVAGEAGQAAGLAPAARIQEGGDPLAHRPSPGGALTRNALLAPHVLGEGLPPAQLVHLRLAAAGHCVHSMCALTAPSSRVQPLARAYSNIF